MAKDNSLYNPDKLDDEFKEYFEHIIEFAHIPKDQIKRAKYFQRRKTQTDLEKELIRGDLFKYLQILVEDKQKLVAQTFKSFMGDSYNDWDTFKRADSLETKNIAGTIYAVPRTCSAEKISTILCKVSEYLENEDGLKNLITNILEYCQARKKIIPACFIPVERVRQSANELNQQQITKSPYLPLKQPCYAEAKQNAREEVNLSPYDHYSIPLFGRNNELDQLDEFLKEEAPFLIFPVIGSSGAGKTRLVTQWLHERVDHQQWYAGLLETSDISKLQKWEPIGNTLIIIDYVYRFKKIIELIIDKAEQYKQHKIRLVPIEHVFPEDLRDLKNGTITNAFIPDRKALEERKKFFYPTLFLEQTINRLEILQDIIVHVSGKEKNSVEIVNAMTMLTDGKTSSESFALNEVQLFPMAHPLFAILIGQALRDGKEITDWKRRDVIDFYLNNKRRLPWRYKDEPEYNGEWMGAFIAAATVRRGLRFDTLKNCLPKTVTLNGENRNRIIDRCCSIVSSENRKWLKPFEPDILGENFFLLFFRYYMDNDNVRNAFINMVCIKENDLNAENQEPDDIGEKYIEFAQRLARNLANDNQNDTEVEEDWETLATFLNPELYPEGSPLRLAVSLAIIEVSDILQDKQLTHLNSSFFKKINADDLVKGSENEKYPRATFAFTKYFDRCSETQREQPEFQSKLITVCKNVEVQNPKLGNSLIIPSNFGCLNIVKFLIEKQCSVDDANSDGYTALMLASYNGYTEIVALLIKNNAKVDLANEGGTTALMFASYNGHTEVAALLIENNAKIDLADKNGVTALMIASHNGHTEIVALLIKNNAKVDLAYESGVTALMLASYHGHTEVAALLIENNAKIDLADKNGVTALMGASYHGHTEVAALLIENNAKVDLADKNGTTALMLASGYGHTKIVTLLIGHNAKVDLVHKNGATALTFASENGYTEIVALLIENNAKVDLADKNGFTALMITSQNGHTKVAALLIENNAKVDLADKDGTTALMLASQYGHTEIVALLIENNAKVDLADKDGTTALMLASQNNRLEVMALLIENNAKVDLPAKDGTTVLMLASYNGRKEVAALLIENSANVDLSNKGGWTALMIAREQGHDRIVKLLLEKGAHE